MDWITCPHCGLTSYNPNDVREGYCGNCHDWTGSAVASKTARAARAFVACIDNPTYLQALETCAKLGGWVGAREAGLWDTRTSDAVTMGALKALIERFRQWAAECDQADAEGAGQPPEDTAPSTRPTPGDPQESDTRSPPAPE